MYLHVHFILEVNFIFTFLIHFRVKYLIVCAHALAEALSYLDWVACVKNWLQFGYYFYISRILLHTGRIVQKISCTVRIIYFVFVISKNKRFPMTLRQFIEDKEKLKRSEQLVNCYKFGFCIHSIHQLNFCEGTIYWAITIWKCQLFKLMLFKHFVVLPVLMPSL